LGEKRFNRDRDHSSRERSSSYGDSLLGSGATLPCEARAHLAGEDDELAMVAPLVALIPVFAALLDMRAANRIARAPIIGRPVGAPEWIATRERRLGRPLAPGKPGPQPRMQPDPRGNCRAPKADIRSTKTAWTATGY